MGHGALTRALTVPDADRHLRLPDNAVVAFSALRLTKTPLHATSARKSVSTGQAPSGIRYGYPSPAMAPSAQSVKRL